MTIDLADRIALVTGGSGQLGRVMCRTLGGCGAAVAVCYHRNAGKAAELVAEIRDTGACAAAVQADVTDQASVNAMKAAVERSLGAPDIIVDNAVIQYQWTHVLDQGIADYESQFRSCVLHNVIMAKTFVPAMVAKRWGRVIAVNTECAMQCFPGQSAYVAGKRGMDGVLRVLAREVGEHQVTVNQVAPGWMVSEDHPADDSQGQRD